MSDENDGRAFSPAAISRRLAITIESRSDEEVAARLAAVGYSTSYETVRRYRRGLTSRIDASFLAALVEAFGADPAFLLIGIHANAMISQARAEAATLREVLEGVERDARLGMIRARATGRAAGAHATIYDLDPEAREAAAEMLTGLQRITHDLDEPTARKIIEEYIKEAQAAAAEAPGEIVELPDLSAFYDRWLVEHADEFEEP